MPCPNSLGHASGTILLLKSNMKIRRTLLLIILTTGSLTAIAQPLHRNSPAIATNTLLTIVRYEDQRNWNDDLQRMFSDANARVRQRAVLAAGRINDKGVEQALRTAFESIKPIDGIYVGMFPRVKDEVKENAEIVHRILTRS